MPRLHRNLCKAFLQRNLTNIHSPVLQVPSPFCPRTEGIDDTDNFDKLWTGALLAKRSFFCFGRVCNHCLDMLDSFFTSC